jgi:hypothetical protein
MPTFPPARSESRLLAISATAFNLGANPRESRSRICSIMTVSSRFVSFLELGSQSRSVPNRSDHLSHILVEMVPIYLRLDWLDIIYEMTNHTLPRPKVLEFLPPI